MSINLMYYCVCDILNVYPMDIGISLYFVCNLAISHLENQFFVLIYIMQNKEGEMLFFL